MYCNAHAWDVQESRLTATRQRPVIARSHLEDTGACSDELLVMGIANSWFGSSASRAQTCEDSFSELRSCAPSASSAVSLEQWFAVQARLQWRTSLLLEKIAYVKHGCTSIVERLTM